VRIAAPALLSGPLLQIVNPFSFVLALTLRVDERANTQVHVVSKASRIRAFLRHHASHPIRRVILESPREAVSSLPRHRSLSKAHASLHLANVFSTAFVRVLCLSQLSFFIPQAGQRLLVLFFREVMPFHLLVVVLGLAVANAANPAFDDGLEFDGVEESELFFGQCAFSQLRGCHVAD